MSLDLEELAVTRRVSERKLYRAAEQVFVAQPLLLDPVGKDGGEPTEAELAAAAAAAAQRAAQQSQTPTVQAPIQQTAVPGIQQQFAQQLPPGVIDDGARDSDAMQLYTLGRITLDHELLAYQMVHHESGMDPGENLPEELQKSLYVEPISFTQTLFSEAMYPKPPGPTPPTKWRVRKVCIPSLSAAVSSIKPGQA